MAPTKKTLGDFETVHGQSKIKALQRNLETERRKVEALADVQHKITVETKSTSDLLFGILGCTHFGSLYHNGAAMEAYYEYLSLRGISTCYCGGDVLDGWKVYKGQEFELRDVGLDAQLDRFSKFNSHGVKTKFITGNHDQSFKSLAGVHVGKAIEGNSKGSWEFLGEEQARVQFSTPNGKYSLMLIHPGGGSSYALSYRPQKIVESLEGGTKPNMLAIAHYHKAEFMPAYRNVATLQTGCFHREARVATPTGPRRICDLAVGDYVLTHANRYRRVKQVLTRKYQGKWTKILFGRKGSGETLSSTADHPVLCLKPGAQAPVFIEAKKIERGDTVYVSAAQCTVCGRDIPYWARMCSTCNPMDHETVRAAATRARHGKDIGPIVAMHGANHEWQAQKHLIEDVVPACEQLARDGWTIIPTTGIVMPDAVGFKNGELVLFEFEKLHGAQLARKKLKYEQAYWLSQFPHRVAWVDVAPRAARDQASTVPGPAGFIGVSVIDVETAERASTIVYNLEVEEDETYVCQDVVVHNCFQNQTPFMSRQGLAAHLGGWIVSVRVGKGYNSVSAEFIAFYE